MAYWLNHLRKKGFTQICVARGTVLLPGEGDWRGEVKLFYNNSKMDNDYCIYTSKTTGDEMWVCELLMFYSFTSKSALTKTKRISFRPVREGPGDEVGGGGGGVTIRKYFDA